MAYANVKKIIITGCYERKGGGREGGRERERDLCRKKCVHFISRIKPQNTK